MAWLAAALVAAQPGAPAAQPIERFWPELQLHYRVDPQTVVMVFAGATRDTDSGARLDWHLGAGLSYRFDRLVSVRAGYRQVFPAGGEGKTEQRIELDQNTRIAGPLDVQIGLRTRVEGRNRGDGNSFRVRERLQLERDTLIGGYAFAPYGSAEIFYDSRHDKISKTRFVVGVVLPATDDLNIDVYAAREIERTGSGRKITALGLAAIFNF